MIEDATGSSDAMRKFKASQTVFQRPVTVDWNHGRAGELGGKIESGIPGTAGFVEVC